MSVSPALGLNETLIPLVGVLVSALFVTIRILITNNLAFADWWARTFKMGAWKRKTSGIENRSSWEKNGLPAPERELCEYYRRFAQAADEYTFKNAYEWLKLSGQSATTPLSVIYLLILFILTFGEAMGTGLLLAPFISTQMTGSMVAPAGFGVATFMAVAMLGLTHWAGSEAAFANAIKDNIGSSVSTEKFNICRIGAGDDYRIDDGMEPNRRFANRALNGDHHRANIWGRVFAFTFLTGIVLAIFGIRFYENRQQYDNNVQELPSASAACGTPSNAASSSDPFSNMNSGGKNTIPGFASGTTSPPSVNCNATTAHDNGAKDSLLSGEMAADTAAVMLALFYVIVQLLGFNLAKKHSFFGEGEKAYATTQGYISYDELRRDRLEHVYKLGNHALHILRNHLIQRVNKYRDNPADIGIQEYIYRIGLGNTADLSPAEKEKARGIEALKKAIDYRNMLRSSEPNLTEYPKTLEDYHGYMLAKKNNHQVTSDQSKQTPSTPPPVKAPPVLDALIPIVQAHPVSAKADLSAYDVLDVEAAEEMIRAGGVLERKKILAEMSEGNEEKKALLEEIYKKLKES